VRKEKVKRQRAKVKDGGKGEMETFFARGASYPLPFEVCLLTLAFKL
jgi:hypothetical protein